MLLNSCWIKKIGRLAVRTATLHIAVRTLHICNEYVIDNLSIVGSALEEDEWNPITVLPTVPQTLNQFGLPSLQCVRFLIEPWFRELTPIRYLEPGLKNMNTRSLQTKDSLAERANLTWAFDIFQNNVRASILVKSTHFVYISLKKLHPLVFTLDVDKQSQQT